MYRRPVKASFAALPMLDAAASGGAGLDEIDASLVVHGVRIPGRITLPAGAPRGAVLLVPGSLFSDVDGDYPVWNMRPHVYRDLARQLAARGLTSMRQAKIGPQTGSETLDPEAAAAHRHFAARVAVVRVALAHLRAAAPGVRAVVAGHSEGAVVASLFGAQEAELDGVVSLSGPALRLFDVMRGQIAATAGDMSVFDAFVRAVRQGEPTPEAARSDPATAMMANMPPESLVYIREVDAVDPVAAVARVRAPMLLVQGGRDMSVTPEQVDQLAAAREGQPTEVMRFAELQHFYKRAAPGLSGIESFGLSEESDPAVADAIAAWIGAF